MRSTKAMISLCVNEKSLTQYARGGVVGQVWFVLGEKSFPEERWSDFPLCVLACAMEELKKPFHDDTVWYFYDGPFTWSISSDLVFSTYYKDQIVETYPLNDEEMRALHENVRSTSIISLAQCDALGFKRTRDWEHLSWLLNGF